MSVQMGRPGRSGRPRHTSQGRSHMERRFDRDPSDAEAGGGVATTDPTRGETARRARANGGGSRGTEASPMRMLPVTADPGPLGLASFAATTFILSMFNSGLMGG